MADTGIITLSGSGSYSLGAWRDFGDIETYIYNITNPKIVVVDNVHPYRVRFAGGFGLGEGDNSDFRPHLKMVTWWFWLEFEQQNFANQLGATYGGNTIFYKFTDGCTVDLTGWY